MLSTVARLRASSSLAVPLPISSARLTISRTCAGESRLADEHIDGVLAKAVELLEALDRHEFSVDQQLLEALLLRPFGDLGVKAFARLDQRREHADAALARERSPRAWPRPRRVCFSTGTSHFGQNCVPSLANSSRRK